MERYKASASAASKRFLTHLVYDLFNIFNKYTKITTLFTPMTFLQDFVSKVNEEGGAVLHPSDANISKQH